MPFDADILRRSLLEGWDKGGFTDAAQEAAYFEKAYKMLSEFILSEGAAAPIAVEDFFRIDVGGRSVTGRIDRVDAASGGVEIIDYRTGSYVPKEYEVAEDLQFGIYCLAAEQRYGAAPAKVTICVLEKGLKVTREPRPGETQRTRERVGELFERISADRDFPSLRNRFCPSCEYAELCGAGAAGFVEFGRAVSGMAAAGIDHCQIARAVLSRMIEVSGSVGGVFLERTADGVFNAVCSSGAGASVSEALRETGAHQGIRAAAGRILVPLIFGGTQVGTVVLCNDGAGRLPPVRTAMLESLSLHAASMLNGAALKASARLDALTGLFNRSYFDECLAEKVEAARAGRLGLALVMGDVDHFKKVNDTYGHQTGDAVLRGVARIIKECTDVRGAAARYGGEEFACILPGIDAAKAAEFGETLRRGVGNEPVDAGGVLIPVTLSAGVAVFDGSESPGGLLRRADENLYRAKQGGRNRVVS
jgi:diguanylate cyclase (GGDEF)-like protein